MTQVIVIMVVCIAIGIIANMRMNKEIKTLRELEKRLDEYYRQREQRLKDKGI